VSRSPPANAGLPGAARQARRHHEPPHRPALDAYIDALPGWQQNICRQVRDLVHAADLGFSDEANLDEGAVWPTYFALTELAAADEARIGALVKQASAEDRLNAAHCGRRNGPGGQGAAMVRGQIAATASN
jgi:hypothetical protein